MKVSILISSYNGKEHIASLLNSIGRLSLGSHEMEVILRDDNSSDGTAEEVAKNYPWAKLITGTRTLGFGKSNNAAMRNATGDVICCVNQDTILDSHFLLEGLNVLERHPDVVGVNTNMIMPWIFSLEDFQEVSREDIPAYEYRLTPYGITEYVAVERVVTETNFLTGGGFFLRRSALIKEDELFNPRIRMYCEDTDLSLRLRKRGGKLMYAPKSILFHNQMTKKAESFSEISKAFKITWNRFYVLSCHFPPLSFLKHYPLYVWGIVRKMDYLGLPSSRKFLAYFAGGFLTIPFFAFLPYWLWHSFFLQKKRSLVDICRFEKQ
jgi:GT2 family glycosyltransferase